MTLQCQAVLEELAAFQDGELKVERQFEIQTHLTSCDSCRQEAKAQESIRQGLRKLRQQDAMVRVPTRMWANAAQEWDRRDARKRMRVQMRLGFAGACMLLFLISAVWARLAERVDFPVSSVMQDFRMVRATKVMPEFETADPDAAAQWLRKRLDSEVPPINLSLSQGRLLGVDVVKLAGTETGRLLYRGPQGLIGVYITPRGTNFANLEKVTFEKREFERDNTSKDIGFYGWQQGKVGYGLALPQPMAAGTGFALDAERNIAEPKR